MPRKRRKTAAETIAEIPIEEIQKLSGSEGMKQLARYVNVLKQGVKRRAEQFARAGEFSYALDALEKQKPSMKKASDIGIGQPTMRRRGKLVSDIVKYQQFFKDQTSTLEGIKEVNRKQDIRIFGEVLNEEGEKTGAPVATMTADERREFWSVYMEYEKSPQYAVDLTGYVASSTVQMLLQDMMTKHPTLDKAQLMEKVHEEFQTMEVQRLMEAAKQGKESVANVFSGRRGNN